MTEIMKINKIISLFIILTPLAYGCVKESGSNDDRASLEVRSVVMDHPAVKSVMDGPAFPADEAARGIGLSLMSGNEDKYDGVSYVNVKYCDEGAGWKSSNPIMLSGTTGILYGYFPYDESVSDIREIPVAASLNGTDHMYVEPVSDISITRRMVSLEMKHALARVTVKFLKEGPFPGNGMISSISISGPAIAQEGILNAMDGSISASSAKVTFCLDREDRITEQGAIEELLIVPSSNSEGAGSILLECTIDGQEYTIPLDGISVGSGIHTVITVKVSNIGLCVAETSSDEEWDDMITVRTDDGKTVFVELSGDVYENDILMNAYPDGNDVIINAVSLSGMPIAVQTPARICTHTDGQGRTSKYFESTISDIKENLTVSVGYDAVAMARTDVPNTAFYKDIFLDAGVSLDRCSSIPLGIRNIYGLTSGSLTDQTNWEHVEFFNFSESTDETVQIQRSIIAGNENDLNGILLYPDGAPRFKLMYGYGGKSSKHAESLGETGCLRVNQFYSNGGSYVASCASTILSAKKYGSSEQALSYDMLDGGATVFSGMYISNLRYYNNVTLEEGTNFQQLYCNGLSQINELAHNGGAMLDEETAPAGTEVLARFASTAYPIENTYEGSNLNKCLGKPCVWAYKRNDRSGRLVVCGSHPEICNTDDVTTLFTAEFLYAMDGQGCATAKATLQNGVTRQMDLHEGDPSYCAIGDRQCHHFVIFFPKPVSKLSVLLDWDSKARLDLAMRQGSFAFPDGEYDFCALSPKETEFISPTLELEAHDIPAGMYYIAVRCASMPEINIKKGSSSTTYYFEYSGTEDEMQTLNGVPYNITASWSYK